ncbi:hypothetical protein G6F22_021440 [Rhizopus arrhizus]|nr:hypothetical protein G6F22_021440 [Rhizopus arrhizus]
MATKTSKAAGAEQDATASEKIDARIRELDDWRGDALAQVRKWIKQAVPDVAETWKWRGVPVWEHGGILCTGETYKAAPLVHGLVSPC